MTQLAYLNGNLIPNEELSVSVFDLGFVQGVTVSEQLRTFNGKLFQVQQHASRLRRSLEITGIGSVDLDALLQEAETVVSHNHSLMQPHDDLGLTIFITPGQNSNCNQDNGSRATVGMYTTPLPFHNWQSKYADGQELVVSSIRQVPENCWSPELKCRSRMHYFLADQEIRRDAPDARAVLLDQDGFVAEASTASVLIYQPNEGLISPRAEKVLPSVSVGVIKSICATLQIPFVHRDIKVEELESADEVLLSSTSPCLLPVVKVNHQPIGDGKPGQTFDRILNRWNELAGLDIVEQATRINCR